jgi:uncharacterized BrkB/YihY/UPF0761 family membrane protein
MMGYLVANNKQVAEISSACRNEVNFEFCVFLSVHGWQNFKRQKVFSNFGAFIPVSIAIGIGIRVDFVESSSLTRRYFFERCFRAVIAVVVLAIVVVVTITWCQFVIHFTILPKLFKAQHYQTGLGCVR